MEIARYNLGKKAPKKNWKTEEMDKEREDKQILFVFLGLFVMFFLLGLFMWWMKQRGV